MIIVNMHGIADRGAGGREQGAWSMGERSASWRRADSQCGTSTEHGARSMGHGAWGTELGAWRAGHGARGIEDGARSLGKKILCKSVRLVKGWKSATLSLYLPFIN